jgi:hypothetical protein
MPKIEAAFDGILSQFVRPDAGESCLGLFKLGFRSDTQKVFENACLGIDVMVVIGILRHGRSGHGRRARRQRS